MELSEQMHKIIDSELTTEQKADAIRMLPEMRIMQEKAEKLDSLRQVISDGEERNYWIWVGDGYDHLESLTCSVLISAEKFRNIINRRNEVEDILSKIQENAPPCPAAALDDCPWCRELGQGKILEWKEKAEEFDNFYLPDSLDKVKEWKEKAEKFDLIDGLPLSEAWWKKVKKWKENSDKWEHSHGRVMELQNAEDNLKIVMSGYKVVEKCKTLVCKVDSMLCEHGLRPCIQDEQGNETGEIIRDVEPEEFNKFARSAYLELYDGKDIYLDEKRSLRMEEPK